jgi:ribosomal protein L37AE/L43A
MKAASAATISGSGQERLIQRTVSATKADGRHQEICGKCGPPNRVKIPVGQVRVIYKCKECGQQQKTM